MNALIKLFEKRTGYPPDLDNPRTYCEKALWSKLYNQDPRLVEYGDKLVAKSIVDGNLIHAIPTLMLDPVEPPFYPVMVRINNRSGFSRVVNNRKEWQHLISTLPKKPYGSEKGEWHYQHMDTHILVEPVIKNFVEVKFFCFGGRVAYLYLVGEEHKTFFTREEQLLPIQQKINNKAYTGTKFQSMLPPVSHLIPEVERLADDFPHVRVDLMITKDKVFLSEFTFFHMSGMLKFHPKEFDYELGKPWQIEA